MARGWESKSVEDQIGAAEEKQYSKAKRLLTQTEIEEQKRKQGLELERARIKREMEKGHKRRYMNLLERTLAHVEAEITKIEKASEERRM